VPRIRRALLPLLAAISVAATSAFAQAAIAQRTGLVNRSGTYNGRIDELSPQAYTGHIHFVVSRGTITGLRFTAGALCGVLWVVDTDNALPTFPVRVTSGGAFSYNGTVAGRLIQINGRLTGNTAYGTFFQAFPWGQTTCTMGQVASFTATR
jgi:hypothetical protein